VSASASQSVSESASPSPSPSPAPSPSASASPVATSFSGTSAVGALFTVSGKGHLQHFCTGAVVYSPHGNLVITAAHCVQGRQLGSTGNVIFAPGYHNGRFPHGKWQVMSAIVDRAWQKNENPNDDVAFLVVGRDGRRIEKYTGAESIRTDVSLPKYVQVIGYPDSASDPVECHGKARTLALAGYQQLVFDCGGYTGGTSGGPFLMDVDSQTGLGVVIGVIGGYELGGLLPNVSYASEFLKNIARLYASAKKA
jgi:V8-like Glu-specific endopeptidase